MKVYELMSELAKLESGIDVTVAICLTTEELKSGDEIESNLYIKQLKICEVSEDGFIETEV